MEEKRVTFIFFFFKNRSKESIISNLIIYNFYREKKKKDVRSNIVNIFLTGFRKEERLKIPSLIETLPRRLDALFEGRRREKLVFFPKRTSFPSCLPGCGFPGNRGMVDIFVSRRGREQGERREKGINLEYVGKTSVRAPLCFYF